MNTVMRVMSLVFFFAASVYAKFEHAYDPLLVVVIMVKNEEAVMRDTLQPFIDGGVDSFFVLDTGSTDNTVAVTEEFFDEYRIEHAYIAQEPFIDFAASRNRALDLAQEKFPHAAFMVMIDAEWYINDARLLVDYCQRCLDRGDMYPSYSIHIINTALDSYATRLIRCNRGVRFGGAVHETVIQTTNVKVPDTVYFEYLPTDDGYAKSFARFTRDRELLLKEHYKNPRCTRTLFYLARTCEDLGNLEEAYNFYQKRVDLIGWPEEDYQSYYRFGETIKKLALQNNPHYQWSQALMCYLKAYQMRPHRAEPLIAIADYYVAINQMKTAFLFARQAAEMPFPQNELLFIEKYGYNYYRYELLARCAWYSDEFEIGEWAARMAYDACPEYHIALTNMQCYLERTMS